MENDVPMPEVFMGSGVSHPSSLYGVLSTCGRKVDYTEELEEIPLVLSDNTVSPLPTS